MTFEEALDAVLAECKQMLMEKNAAYDNAALQPLNVFSKLSREEQINVRIDDKLKRIRNGAPGEDSEHDLLNYLILKRVGRMTG
jgi:hypothetical protein